MGLNDARGLAALVITALPLASLTGTFSVAGADAVYAGNGNGNGGRMTTAATVVSAPPAWATRGLTTGATAIVAGAPTTRRKGGAIPKAGAPRSMGMDGVPLPANSRA